MDMIEYSRYLYLALNDKLKTLDYIDSLYNIEVKFINYNMLEILIITNNQEKFKGHLLRFETKFKILDDINQVVYYLDYKLN